MNFGLIIVGDEILSGKRQDKHFAKAIEILGKRGLELDWAEYLGDDPARITATWSAISAISPRSCVMNSTAIPRSSRSLRIRSRICR